MSHMNRRRRARGGASCRVMLALGFFALAAGLMLSLGSCRSDDRDRVVLYVSADDYVAREVIEAFERKTGIRVDWVGDVEATKTTGLVNRIRDERNNPQADVFWSSEVFMTIQLADEGLLAEHISEATADWPRHLRDGGRLWYGFAPRARVIVYAPDRVSGDDIPRTWMDLGRPQFRDRVVMADPRFGTTLGHLGAMAAWWDANIMPGYYESYLEKLRENNVRLLTTGNAGVVEAVGRGEADVGMTDTDDVWAGQERGFNVDLVYASHGEPGETGAGTLLIPNTVALINGSRHPEQAAILIDFLLSEEVERILAESVSANLPIRPEVAAEYPHLAVPNPLQIDLRIVAERMTDALEMAMRILDDGN